MFPWMWVWTPQVHFPFSGGVAQQIEPNLGWFFDGIRPAAGNGDIERKAFDIASYGKQLGLITEVLLGEVAKDAIPPGKSAEALGKLRQIHDRIEAEKRRDAADIAQSISEQLDQLRLRYPDTYRALVREIQRPAASGPHD
jgi:hypothetical protein